MTSTASRPTPASVCAVGGGPLRLGVTPLNPNTLDTMIESINRRPAQAENPIAIAILVYFVIEVPPFPGYTSIRIHPSNRAHRALAEQQGVSAAQLQQGKEDRHNNALKLVRVGQRPASREFTSCKRLNLTSGNNNRLILIQID